MADEFVNRLTPLQRGTSYPAVRDEDVKRQIIEIPPAREQERIVAKIDELFSELDAGVASLKRAKALLKKYRQAVLKAAVTGELSRNWRERHQGEIRESGAELLQRILKARRAAWEAAELKKLRVKGKPPKDDRWKQKYKEPQPPDTSDLPALPDGWVWASIDQLAAPERNSITDGPFGSNLKTAHYTDAGPRVVRLENIGEAKFIDIETHIDLAHFSKLSKHQIFPNDIVIASLGQPLPRACLVPSDLGPAIVKADCIRFNPIKTWRILDTLCTHSTVKLCKMLSKGKFTGSDAPG